MGIEIKDGLVKFTYQASADTTRVALAGTFNYWDYQGHYLTQRDETTWEITLPLAPGRHLYKYVINDTLWLLDPENKDISEDAQNNSSFTLIDGLILYRHEATAEQPGHIWQHYVARKSAEWINEAVIYQLNIRQFSKEGFRGLSDKLPYLKELGVNTLWLMPFFEVGVKNRHGKYGDLYAVKSFYTIDKEYGTKEDFRQFVASAHREGFKIIMDWTLNRMSADADIATKQPEWFTQNERGELYYKVPGRNAFIGFNFDQPALRKYIISALKYWVSEFKVDGFRFDDSNITPTDFLNEIRQALETTKKELLLISQAYNELHHLKFADLTYEGSLRGLLLDVVHYRKSGQDLAREYEHVTYSFPKNALRMRWLEEKEQGRISQFVSYNSLFALTSIHLTLDGVPFILMGQEFNDKNWQNYLSLSEPFELGWPQFDVPLFNHFQRLIKLRLDNMAFCHGDVTFINNEAAQVVSFYRQFHQEKFLVVVNLADAPRRVTLPENSSHYRVVFSDDELEKITANSLLLGAYKTVICKLTAPI